MIQTVADLLQNLIEVERRVLNAQKITHRPTIGAMWEDLSREVLERGIPCKGLAVSSGFIESDSGELSAELDCVLVSGEGRAIPRTDKRIFRPNEVIAVIQVKKTLYQKDVKEGFENLDSILQLGDKWEGPGSITAKRSFQIIARRPLPSDIETLPPLLKHLYLCLVGEAVLPCRIILGYHGFKTEKTFRKGLLDYFSQVISDSDSDEEWGWGWGPVAFPGFIIGPNAMAIKNTAMPWGSPIMDGWWPLLVTNGTMKPAMCLLQAIWSRLNHMGLIDCEFFGEDLGMEGLTPLLDVKVIDDSTWEVRLRTSSVDETEYRDDAFQWSPAFVGTPASTLVMMMARCDPEPLDITEFKDDPEIQEGIRELEEAGIAGRSVSDLMHLSFLTSRCDSAFLPDGRCAVAENNSGRLSRWVAKFIEERRNQ